MIKTLWQLILILTLSLLIGLVYNQFSKSPLPLFQKYDFHTANISTNNNSKETLIIYFNDIDAETLQRLLESSMAILLDAREQGEFQKGYIPGAVSFPISQFKEKFNSLTTLLNEGKTIITYCEGIHCTDSSFLASELYKNGYTDIFVYKGGMEDWMSLGNPVETPNEDVN